MSFFETLQDFWDARDLRKIRERRRRKAEKFLEELSLKNQQNKDDSTKAENAEIDELNDENVETRVVSIKDAKKQMLSSENNYLLFLRKLNLKMGMFFIAILSSLLLFLLIILLSSDIFAVKTFELSFKENMKIDEENIKKSLEPFLNKNIFLLSLDEVKSDILTNYSNIDSITLEKAYPRSVMVKVTEFKPALILRQGELPGDEFLINQAGYVMAKRGYSGLNAEYVTVLSTGSLEGTTVGSVVFSRNQVDFIYRAENALRDKVGVPIISVWWLERENELHIWTKKYFKVLMSFERSVDEQIQDMILALGNSGIKKSNFEYIDLRVKGKVFVKPR